MTDGYKEALEQAQTELRMLEERRANLLKLIVNLKALSQDELYELTPPPGYEPEGMTAEIRKVLNLTTAHLTATQIRDSLIQRGFSKANPKNLLIAVHTVLGRIEKELDVIERDGKSAFKSKVQLSIYGPNSLTEMIAQAAKQVVAAQPYYQKAIEEALKSMGMGTFPQSPVMPNFGPGTVTIKRKA